MKPPRALLLLSPLVGLGVVVLLSFRTGASLARLPGAIPLPYHLGAFGAFALSLLGRGARLAILARGVGTRLAFPGAVATQLGGEAAAAVTPSRSGSDPVRLLYLRKLGVDIPRGLAVLLGEIMAEGVALTFVMVALFFFFPASAPLVLGALPYAVTALAMPFVAFFLAGRPTGREPPLWWQKLRLRPGHWRRLRVGARRFGSQARGLARLRAGTVGGVVLVSFLHILARLAILPVLTQGAAPGVPLAPLVAWPLLLLYTGSLLPPPGGGGAIEVTFAAGLTPVLGPGPLPGLLLWWRFYTFYLGAVVGALILTAGLGTAGVKAIRQGRKPSEQREGTNAGTAYGIVPD